MSGIPEHEIVRDYGMHPIDRPLTGYEVLGWWNGTRFFGADLGPDWTEAKAYWWIAVNTLRETKPPDVTISLRMNAVTGPYPRPSWTVAKVTL